MGTGQTLTIKASELTAPFFCKAENSLGTGRSNITQIDVQCTYHMIQNILADLQEQGQSYLSMNAMNVCLSFCPSVC